MSRYQLSAKNPGQTVVCGYDAPLQSWFATVTEERADLDDDNVVLWIGGRPRDCVRLDDLVSRLKPYADVPPELLRRLEQDRETAPPPSPLQREILRIMECGGRGR